MILGNIDADCNESLFLPKAVIEALEFIKNTDFSKLPNGKHPINGGNSFIILDEYNTKQKKEKKAEQHIKYIDIHYLIKGKEAIGIGYNNTQNIIADTYNEEKDRRLFSFMKDEVFFVIHQGMYAILFPSDIHRPGCNDKNEVMVRKAVIKIGINLL